MKEMSHRVMWVNLFLMALLVVESCMGSICAGGTSRNRFIRISNGEPINNAEDPSFFLNKKTKFYGFSKKPIETVRSMKEKRLDVPPMSSTEEHGYEGPAEQQKEQTIPEEGGVVRITRPTNAQVHRSKRQTVNNNRRLYDKPNVYELSAKKNPNSINIPEEGGVVFINQPHFAKQGLKKRKRNLEGRSISGTSTDSLQIPGIYSVVAGRRDLSGSAGFENATKFIIKETAAITSKQDSPGFGAVGKQQENITSNGLESILAANPVNLINKQENITMANVQITMPAKYNVVSGTSSSMRSGRGENVTQVPLEETAAVTSEPNVSSIYIGSSAYPFFAAVHNHVNGPVSFDDVQCSGGIVSEVAVVSSCSCLFADEWPSPPLAMYYVTVGHINNANINATLLHRVRGVKYHPSCDKLMTGLWKGNIAILLITKPGIQFGKHVQPMNLPKLKMWDASDILAKMSDQRRHCRVIGWSRDAPLIDTAIGKLIPLDECANPVCKQNMPCPERSTVDGFMVEITPNEPSLLPGALLYCSEHVFAIVNTKRQCATNHVFAACSPEELLYTKFDFELTPEAQREMVQYSNTFAKTIEGWETFMYPAKSNATTASATTLFAVVANQKAFADIQSSGANFLPFNVYREACWLYAYGFAAGYFVYVILLAFNLN